MPKIRRKTENGTSMIAIGNLTQDLVLSLIKERHDMKREREQLNDRIREIRKEAYNLTVKINQFEDKIEEYVLKQVKRQ